MKIKNVLPVLCPALLLLAGCATTVERKDSGGRETITTTGLDQKDWNTVTDQVINSLRDYVNSTQLQASPGKPSLLAISRIVNSTTMHVDTDNVVKKIRESLLATGKVATLTTVGINGAEDPIAEEERKRARLAGIEPSRPDYTLSGKIIERRGKAGNVTEYVYVFQLSLTKNPDGYAVWEKEQQTDAKQVRRGGATW